MILDEFSYALGLLYAKSLEESDVIVSINDFSSALFAVQAHKTPEIDVEKAKEIVSKVMIEKEKEANDKKKAEGDKFFAENGKQTGVITTDTGLQYKVLKEGDGQKPGPHSKVTVHYEGKFLDGMVFDSSLQRGEPISFGLEGVIEGWREGLQLMKTGGKYELYIPYDLAYGENGIPGTIPPCSSLIFTVELLAVE